MLNFCAVFLGIMAGIVLLEICLRIYNPVNQTVKGDRIVLRVNYDEVLDNEDIPGLAHQSRKHINSIGFRGPDPPEDLSKRLSVITIGGSTTRSAAHSDDRTWTSFVGAALANCFKSVWINNAGFDGHSSFAHIQLIQGYVRKLHPKMVLLLIGANDIYADGYEPSEMQAYEQEQVTGPVTFRTGVKGLLKGLANRSEVIALGLTFYRSYRAWKEGLAIPYVEWRTLAEADPMPVNGEALLAAAEQRQRAYASRLRKIIDLLKEGNTTPVLLTQPSPFGPYIDGTTGKDMLRVENGLFKYRMIEIFNDTMRQVSKAENVHLIDLSGRLNDTKYFFDYWHFTNEGEERLAHLVASDLLSFVAIKFSSYSKGECTSDLVQSPKQPAHADALAPL